MPAGLATLRDWICDARASCDMRVEEIPWARSREWRFEGGRLRHALGAYFSVVGVRACIRGAQIAQPLLDQPEIGILGFLVRRGSGGTEFLVQAKPEPGNEGLVQAAPTVQATESNYRRRHGGRATPHLDRFVARALSSSLQSEQGTRFLGKSNRNMVVEGDAAEGAALRWFPAHDLRELLLEDFAVNTDARSVLASGPWGLLAPGGAPFARWRREGGPGEALLRSLEAAEPVRPVAERLARLRAAADPRTEVVRLEDLDGWEITDAAIRGPGFSIRQFAVATTAREVWRWDQPLVASAEEGRAVLLCREEGGVLRLLFRARAEPGFRERLQLGPTIQDPGDGFPPSSPTPREEGRVLVSTRHSDEGGRFFRCVSRYAVRVLDGGGPAGDDLFPLTLGQVRRLIGRPGVFSSEARTLVSLLLAWA